MPTLIATELDAITSDADFFRCLPLSAVMAVRVCLARQARHGQRVAISSSGAMQLGRQPGYATRIRNFGRCRDCGLGRAVAARVGGEP